MSCTVGEERVSCGGVVFSSALVASVVPRPIVSTTNRNRLSFICNFSLRGGRGRLSGRQYPEQEGRYFIARVEWIGDRMLDRRHGLEKGGDCRRVLFRKLRKGVPGHDRRKGAAVRSLSLLQRRHDLLRRPVADPGVLVRRDVSPGERAE